MILAFMIYIIGNNRQDRWVIFTRSLQLIIILALISIPIPPHVLNILQELNKIAFFDILGQYDIWSNFPFLKFNNNINVPFIIQQMQTISFNN